jgi:hypothetical protein
MHLLSTVAIGSMLLKVEMAGGIQGATTVGVHGIGVSAPIAAAVALATAGFAMLLHMPKGGMFVGRICAIVAEGIAPRIMGAAGKGSATNVEGAKPMLHCRRVPVQRGCDIVLFSLGRSDRRGSPLFNDRR